MGALLGLHWGTQDTLIWGQWPLIVLSSVGSRSEEAKGVGAALCETVGAQWVVRIYLEAWSGCPGWTVALIPWDLGEAALSAILGSASGAEGREDIMTLRGSRHRDPGRKEAGLSSDWHLISLKPQLFRNIPSLAASQGEDGGAQSSKAAVIQASTDLRPTLPGTTRSLPLDWDVTFCKAL